MRKRVLWSFLLISSIFFSQLVEAADTAPADLGSLGFGIGIGLTWLNKTDIRAADVKGGVVRITDEEKQIRAFWLETHYLFDRYK